MSNVTREEILSNEKLRWVSNAFCDLALIEADPRFDYATYLYRYYDDDGDLLYIGITCDSLRRDEQHCKYSPWRRSYARHVRIELFPDRPIADRAEDIAIVAERPRFNKFKTRGKADHTPYPAHAWYVTDAGGYYGCASVWAEMLDTEKFYNMPLLCAAPQWAA